MIISNKDKAREIVDNWVAKGGKGYPSLEPKLVDAIFHIWLPGRRKLCVFLGGPLLPRFRVR